MAKGKCNKCGRELEEVKFYKYRDGSLLEMCKKCLTLHVDVFDDSTFLWILEKMDVPYVPQEWNKVIENKLSKYPNKPLDHSAVFGSYIARTKLKQLKDYHWADNERIQEELFAKEQITKEQQEELDNFYQQQLDEGIISEAEFKTLSSPKQQEAHQAKQFAEQADYIGENNFYDERKFINEEELPDPAASLTQEDKVYLAMKWGTLYRPSELLELEGMYDDMAEAFEINDPDSKHSLILYCKTNLKSNQAIDNGDIEGYQKLSKISESLRKTNKWTAQQRKEDEKGMIDSIGQLITLCERDGFIPRFATDIPQDKVDATLRDMNMYLNKLVTQDLGFGQQIEDQMRKIALAKQHEEEMSKIDEEESNVTDEYIPQELQDEDFKEFYDFTRELQEADLREEAGEADGAI